MRAHGDRVQLLKKLLDLYWSENMVHATAQRRYEEVAMFSLRRRAVA